jgi:hypothetical protein
VEFASGAGAYRSSVMRSRARVGCVVAVSWTASVVLAAVATPALSLTGSTAVAGTALPIKQGTEASLSQTFGGVVPAGDLSGDGHGDVLDERHVTDGERDVASITARDGRTGRALWRWKAPYPDSGVLNATTGRIGLSGRLGVLVVSNSFQVSTDATVVTLRALSGRTGRQVWRRRISSGPDGDIELVDAAHELPGRDEDLVVALVGAGSRALLRPLVVSGVDGHLHRLPPHPGAGEPEVILTPTPDLDGDGLDDLVMARGGSHPGIVAEDGSTGRTLWVIRKPGFRRGNAIVTPVGDLTGTGSPDLVITTNPPHFKGRQLQSLVQGNDGRIMWTKRADDVLAVHRAGPQLQPAVDLVDELRPAKDRPGRAGATVRAFTVNGHPIYQTTHTVTDPSPDVTADISVTVAGDFQADGARDLQLSIVGSTRHYVSGWIDSRTGQLHKIPLLTNPVGHLSHHKGSDLIELQPGGSESSHLTITADGISHRVFWRHALRVPKLYLGQAMGLRASTRRCSDVLISDSDFPGRQLAAVYTGSGHLLWTLRFAETAIFGGQLHRYQAPRHLCAASAR